MAVNVVWQTHPLCPYYTFLRKWTPQITKKLTSRNPKKVSKRNYALCTSLIGGKVLQCLLHTQNLQDIFILPSCCVPISSMQLSDHQEKKVVKKEHASKFKCSLWIVQSEVNHLKSPHIFSSWIFPFCIWQVTQRLFCQQLPVYLLCILVDCCVKHWII